MKEIVKKIGELHEALVEKDKKLSAVAQDQKTLASELIEKASELSAREQAISQREFEVKKVEDVISMKKEAEALLEKAKQGIADLEDKKKAWANEKIIQENLIVNQRASAAQEAKNNEENRKALDTKAKNIDEEVKRRVDAFLKRIG